MALALAVSIGFTSNLAAILQPLRGLIVKNGDPGQHGQSQGVKGQYQILKIGYLFFSFNWPTFPLGRYIVSLQWISQCEEW